ncbi:hypothetical protein JVU11DRAFT_8055 [Chiua virens]|nr:hypothetical protein JVU11DRAFT_8055 [Chiua virens]
MNLKALLTNLFKEDTPDEEERVDASSPESRQKKDSEKVVDDVTHGSRSTGMDDADSDQDQDQEDYDNAPPVDIQSDTTPRPLHRLLSRVLSAVFPSPSNEEEIQAYLPHYRTLPILSGIAIPFSILLEIPGITSDWYTQTEGSTVVTSKSNPPLLSVGIALSLFCAVLANSLFSRSFFGVAHQNDDDFMCRISFNPRKAVSLFELPSQSGIHSTQAVDSPEGNDHWLSSSSVSFAILHWVLWSIRCFSTCTFVDGLYFTVVTIETIGFGDIVPNGSGSRVFICFYATLGVINLAFVVGYVRETVLEGLDFRYRKRLMAIKEKRRAAALRRHAEHRWRHAVVWRLRERHAPVWIPSNTNDQKSFWSNIKSCARHAEWGIRTAAKRSTHQTRGRHGTKLNLWALPHCQLEAAALEAGVPLDTLLPEDFYDTYDQETCNHSAGVEHHTLPSWFVVHPVYHRPALSTVSSDTSPAGWNGCDALEAELCCLWLCSGSLTISDDSRDYRDIVADTEKKAYVTRSGFDLGLVSRFLDGFISFTTIGYGDLAPVTSVGRAIFVVWALIGVATMTIFISAADTVVSEAYTSRYKGILGRNSFKHVVEKYRSHTEVELSEKMQHIGTKVRFLLDGTVQREETDVVEDESPPASEAADDDDVTPAAPSTSQRDPHSEAEQSLERLPQQILTETRDFDQRSPDTERFVDQVVWNLLDEVMGGRKLTGSTKMDLLHDAESRQTLMVLGIERSLKELMGISEQAIGAIQQRDRIITSLRQEDEAEVRRSSGYSIGHEGVLNTSQERWCEI